MSSELLYPAHKRHRQEFSTLDRLCNFASASSVNAIIALFFVIIAENADATDARFRLSKSLALSGVSFSRLPDNAGISSNPSHHRFHTPKLPMICLVYPFQEGFNGTGAGLYRIVPKFEDTGVFVQCSGWLRWSGQYHPHQ